MIEIELKILETDVPKITAKLLSLGAEKIPTRLIVEKSFDFPDHRISSKKDLFRLRQVGDITEICLKTRQQASAQYLIHEEIETEVKDFVTMEKIIRELGFHCRWHREKKRTSFIYDKVKIEIDEYPGVPPYLEVEGQEKDIERVVGTLGFTMSDTTTRRATEVLQRYHADSDVVTFGD